MKLLYFRFFGPPGTVVHCSDGLEWLVVYNDNQSTVVVYRNNVFRLIIVRINFSLSTLEICSKTRKLIRLAHKDHMRVLRIVHTKPNFTEFYDVVNMFHDIIEYYKENIVHIDPTWHLTANDLFYAFTHHIIHLHHHLRYLCERHVTCIQRVFREANTNPRRVLCRKRLLWEFHELYNLCYRL
jgi:hypothetical protein